MVITIKYYTLFSMAAGYCREEKILCPDNCTLFTLLKVLSSRYGKRMEQLVSTMLTENQNVYWVLVKGKRVRGSDYSLPLTDGDVVVLTTPMLVGG